MCNLQDESDHTEVMKTFFFIYDTALLRLSAVFTREEGAGVEAPQRMMTEM